MTTDKQLPIFHLNAVFAGAVYSRQAVLLRRINSPAGVINEQRVSDVVIGLLEQEV